MWRSPALSAGTGLYATPAHDDSLTFFLLSDHRIRALRAATGTFAWDSPAGGWGQGDYSELLSVGGTVVSLDGDVWAFDARTGALRWVFSDRPSTGAGWGRGASDSTLLFAGSISGSLYAIQLSDGAPRWKVTVATDTTATRVNDPSVKGGVVYATYQRFETTFTSRTGGVIAVDVATGSIVWRTEFPPENGFFGGGATGRAQVGPALVYAVNLDGRVFALNRTDGTVAWIVGRYSARQASETDLRRILLANDVLVIGASDGSVSGVDAASGATLWRTVSQPVEAIFDPMVFDGKEVYFTRLSGQIVKVDRHSGVLTALTPQSEALVVGVYPNLDSTRMYAQTREGFYAFRKP